MAKITQDQARRFVSMMGECGFDVVAYSGRGMCGKECAGISCSAAGELFSIGTAVGAFMETADDAERLGFVLDSPRVDSLGAGIIAYWPRITLPVDDEEGAESA